MFSNTDNVIGTNIRQSIYETPDKQMKTIRMGLCLFKIRIHNLKFNS